MTEPPAGRLTGHERHLIAEARRIGPALRASDSDRDRLAGHLLAGLADALLRRIREERGEAGQ